MKPVVMLLKDAKEKPQIAKNVILAILNNLTSDLNTENAKMLVPLITMKKMTQESV